MKTLSLEQIDSISGGQRESDQACRNAYSGFGGGVAGVIGAETGGPLGAVVGATLGSMIGGWAGDHFCGDHNGGDKVSGGDFGGCSDHGTCTA